jgi:hypothetical protein
MMDLFRKKNKKNIEKSKFLSQIRFSGLIDKLIKKFRHVPIMNPSINNISSLWY